MFALLLLLVCAGVAEGRIEKLAGELASLKRGQISSLRGISDAPGKTENAIIAHTSRSREVRERRRLIGEEFQKLSVEDFDSASDLAVAIVVEDFLSRRDRNALRSATQMFTESDELHSVKRSEIGIEAFAAVGDIEGAATYVESAGKGWTVPERVRLTDPLARLAVIPGEKRPLRRVYASGLEGIEKVYESTPSEARVFSFQVYAIDFLRPLDREPDGLRARFSEAVRRDSGDQSLSVSERLAAAELNFALNGGMDSGSGDILPLSRWLDLIDTLADGSWDDLRMAGSELNRLSRLLGLRDGRETRLLPVEIARLELSQKLVRASGDRRADMILGEKIRRILNPRVRGWSVEPQPVGRIRNE